MDSQPSQEVTDLLKQWEEQNGNSSWDPIPILTRLAEIIEMETENFMKKDPDPFDERHPSRTDPSCALGHALKVMFKKDNFMTKLVNDYVRETYYTRPTMVPGKDVRKLNIAACRLTLDLMPGLEMSVVFQDNEGLIHRLYGWAEKSVEPLQTYATGLLAAAMEVQDIAGSFRDQNARLVPLMLKRLHKLRRRSLQSADPTTSSASSFVASSVASPVTATSVDPSASAEGMSPSMDTVAAQPVAGGAPGQTTRHFARFATSPQQAAAEVNIRKRLRYSDAGGTSNEDPGGTPAKKSPAQSNGYSASSPLSEGMMSPPPRGMVACKSVSSVASVPADSASNSSWAEMETYVIGNIQIHPPTDATRQMLILRYLTPMGEYQEFLSHVFAENALELILGYVNLRESRDSRLAFEALKYLAALLCHKKFSIEFINMNGLQRFLEVPRPSVAATGVSICLYYLAYCEDAMERVCLLPRRVLADLVRYALWLLECSHDSGRCHATMFFGFCFQFRVILEEFDNQDGLRKLYNVISTLPILSVEDDVRLSEDESCAARQIVRHVCVALKRYIESHLHHRAAALRRQERPLGEMHPQQPAYKACKSSPEEIQEQIERLQAAAWTKWAPCDQLLRLGGVTLLLQIVAFSYEWNFNGRAETVRSALDVISACCVAPRAQLLLCEKVDMPDDGPQVGVNIVLAAAEGEIVPDADVQKAALNVIVNCVCSPVHRVGGASARFSSSGSTKKKTNLKSYEDVIQKVWESVRTNNGIMVLLQLMLVKSPITDADCLRGLACRALAGLARCPTVRQIISKLPLFTTEQMQSLMRDPILQEKRQEHVMFQKYALELMERVSELIERVPSKHKASGGEFETSLANIHRANVVAQTHIKFNERQLFQLIYQHLAAKGLTKAAEALRKEAALAPLCPAPALAPPHLYQGNNTPTTPSRLRPLPHGPPRCSASSATASTSAAPEPSSSTSMVNGYINEEPLATPLTPHTIKIRRCQSTSSPSPILGMVAAPPCPPATPSRSLQKAQSLAQGPGAGGGEQEPPQPRISLDNIITEYLANQHALCKNPMVTCAEFNLFQPHKCPDGQRNIRSMATNSTVRHALRQAGMAPLGRHDYRHVHSHFCSLKTFRLQDDDSYFTCCLFHPTQKTLLAGTSSGDVKFFNLFSGQEESSYQLHDSYISHIQASRDGTLLLGSSSTWRNPTSALWNMKNCEMKVALNDEDYVEFSKLSEDKIIGTKAAVATIYDTATGRSLATLKPSFSNLYSKNRATFSPTDELVLSDGVLWDVNGGTEIHKFDKLNQSLSGVFHPNGLEIISNTEVWDLRTFHLLRTVPILDKSEVVFSPLGGILYSIFLEQDGDDKSHYESSFKTLDSHDYSSIATIDVKRNIYALGVAGWGGQVALAENTGGYDTVQESVLKLYDVGRQRDQDDEVDEEDEEEMGNSDNEGSDSASDDASAFRNALAELGLEGGSADDDDDPDDDDEDDDDQDGDDDLDDLGPLLDSDESISDRSWRPARRRARRAPRGQDRRQRREPARRQSNNEEEEEDEESDADSAH